MADIKAQFPELTDAVNAEQGMLCFELEVLARFTQQRIGAGDRDAVLASFRLAEKYYRYGTKKMAGAIDTCYVENLVFKPTKRTNPLWAWDLLPSPLKQLYADFHGHPFEAD